MLTLKKRTAIKNTISFNKNYKRSLGFTIVELLVVVVVIAILSAITIVSYEGIVTRAETARTSDAVSKYLRAIVGYKGLTGEYPTVADERPYGFACLGAAGTKCGNLTDNTFACFGVAAVAYDSTLTDQTKSVLDQVPQPSTQKSKCNNKEYGGAFFADRAYQASTDITAARVVWFLPGRQSCDTVATKFNISSAYEGNTTRCLVYLPEITT